jgi:glycosyltransferase involved in cell wall biosynthesis
MKLGIVSGLRYHRAGSKYYTLSQFDAEMWKECLEVFDEVVLANRVVSKERIAPGEKCVLADGVKLMEFPNCLGFWRAVGVLPGTFWRARKVVRHADVWHLHTPNIVSICMWFWLWLYKIPYSVELRGDQSINVDYLKLRGVRFPAVVSRLMKMFLWLHMSRPVAVATVARFLVDRSRPRNNCPLHVVSNARIPCELYRKPRTWTNDWACRTLVCSGRLEAQKNPIGLVRALAKLEEKGFTSWRFLWIGDGPLKEQTRRLADELNLADKIELLGYVPWQDIFNILDSSDLFVLNSVAEGLPRVVIEAMACALPVIGTRAGAWAEILPAEDVVKPRCDDLLADKLSEVLTDPSRLTKMSQRNLATAANYSAQILREKKVAFYAHVKSLVVNSRNIVSG